MTNEYGNELLHKVLLSAMKDIDKICRENGLRYYLYAGTLLGAINHKGFIPWDDDVDICMPKTDYKTLVTILENDYSDKYYVRTYENTPSNYSKLTKIQIKGAEAVFSNGTRDEIFIDLSVLHSAPDGKIARKIQRFQLEFWSMVLSTKSNVIVPTSVASKLVLKPLSHLSKQFIGRRIDAIMNRYDHLVTEYYALMINMYPSPWNGKNGYLNDFVLREICEEPQYLEFEDTCFMAFSNPDRDLAPRFGKDYRKPYPEEKRRSNHGIVNYELTQELKNRLGL
jgi:lipopolysaccharide cholinephosphotransferase